MGEQTESVFIGFCFGGICNLMGYLLFYPYFTGIDHISRWRRGGYSEEYPRWNMRFTQVGFDRFLNLKKSGGFRSVGRQSL